MTTVASLIISASMLLHSKWGKGCFWLVVEACYWVDEVIADSVKLCLSVFGSPLR